MSYFKNIKISRLLNKASKQRDLYKAIDLYQKIIDIDPTFPVIYNYIGLCYFELNDYEKAESFFRKSIEKFNDNFKSKHEIYYNLAFALHSQNIYEEAEIFYKKSIKENPDYSFAYKNFAYLLFLEKKYKESLEMFKKYITYNEEAEAYNNIGIIYQEFNNDKEAIRYYNLAIETDDSYALAYNNLGAIYMEKKDYEKAAELFDKAIEKDKSLADAYNNLATINFMIKKYNLSLSLYQKALKIAPYNKTIRLNIAQIYYFLNDINNCILYLKELINQGYPLGSILKHEEFKKIEDLEKRLL